MCASHGSADGSAILEAVPSTQGMMRGGRVIGWGWWKEGEGGGAGRGEQEERKGGGSGKQIGRCGC